MRIIGEWCEVENTCRRQDPVWQQEAAKLDQVTGKNTLAARSYGARAGQFLQLDRARKSSIQDTRMR